MCGRARHHTDVLVFQSVSRRLFLCAACVALPLLATVELSACSGKTMNPSDASFDAGHLDEPYFPEASCFVRIDSPALQPGVHVPVGTDITSWDSNPPSSGEHYPIWAAFQEYDAAVPRGFYVHDLEHGAVNFLYKCSPDAGSCDAIVAGLRQAVASLPNDPICDPSIRVRYVLTPDPLLDHPVAAVAWGWTYNADCLDLPTLEAFAKGHYAQAPESQCTNGVTDFDF